MCGIAGFWDSAGRHNIDRLSFHAVAMADKILHRGPNDSGAWDDPSVGIALAHRRLSILDLSSTGHQPMTSCSGRYVIVFNGEIYNYADIRNDVESVSSIIWRGRSDTEVVLAACDVWGVEAAVARFVGMFAFALWDCQARRLYLVRDRIGEKPLYYGWMGDVFLFGSELKALKAHPSWDGDIDRNALAVFLRHNYIPAPYTIYRGIYKLPPGTILSLGTGDWGLGTGKVLQPKPYWQAKDVAERGITTPFRGTDAEAANNLDLLLRDAVKQQMVADVPLGAFLSGGIDSSTIVALMQSQADRPIRTFTIGFSEEGYNEADDARAVARHLGTDHTELYVTPADALAVIPHLPSLYDEPFADSSQIPTFLISKLTRNHVTVSLSGDGGDELFGGYNRYFWGRNIWKSVGWLSPAVRKAFAKGMHALSPEAWDGVFGALDTIMPHKMRQRAPGNKIHKLADVLPVNSPEEMYLRLVSHWQTPSSIVIGAVEPLTAVTDRSRWANLSDFTERMMYLDLVSYLPDDILVKVDRAAMGVSLETRVPFLDHRVVEFAWRLPLHMKIRNGQGKWLLRQVLNKYVPQELIDRPKAGFGIPLDSWLRGPLRDWAEELLAEKRLREEGFFYPGPVRQKWEEHLSGRRNWQYHVWDILMFQAWLEQNRQAIVS